MSDEYDGTQALPIANDGPSMHDLVIEDLRERKAFGLRKYGSLLQAYNGRSGIKDLYDELMDALVYTRQLIEENQEALNDREDGNLVTHARRELELCGQYASDPEYSESLIRAVRAFASYGHSGGSASVAIAQLAALLRFQNLSPITSNPEEWFDHGEMAGKGTRLWQNVRNGALFSDDGGLTYYDVNEEGRPRHASQPTDTLG